MDREEKEVRYRCAVLQALITRPETRPFGRDTDGTDTLTLTAAGELACQHAFVLARKMIEVEKSLRSS